MAQAYADLPEIQDAVIGLGNSRLESYGIQDCLDVLDCA